MDQPTLQSIALRSQRNGVREGQSRKGSRDELLTYSYQFDPAIQVVKAKYPGVRHVGDVRRLTKPAIREEIDLLVGGFPCQDLSCLGKKEG